MWIWTQWIPGHTYTVNGKCKPRVRQAQYLQVSHSPLALHSQQVSTAATKAGKPNSWNTFLLDRIEVAIFEVLYEFVYLCYWESLFLNSHRPKTPWKYLFSSSSRVFWHFWEFTAHKLQRTTNPPTQHSAEGNIAMWRKMPEHLFLRKLRTGTFFAWQQKPRP